MTDSIDLIDDLPDEMIDHGTIITEEVVEEEEVWIGIESLEEEDMEEATIIKTTSESIVNLAVDMEEEEEEIKEIWATNREIIEEWALIKREITNTEGIEAMKEVTEAMKEGTEVMMEGIEVMKEATEVMTEATEDMMEATEEDQEGVAHITEEVEEGTVEESKVSDVLNISDS